MIDPASEECFAKFRKALSEDDAAHPKTTRQNSRLPRRVIEIISGNLPENFRLRLRTNDVKVENRPPDPYAALSYCWGGPQPLQTTKSNQKERMHDLEFSKLPKTIADAVICTHNLNLKYLWVDSMCIIQDCEEDKTRELGVMAGIYSDAYVTIQAARAPTSTSGFLAPCEPEHISISLPYCCPSDEFGSVTLTPIRGVVPVSASVKQVLDGRGWTFQEMILSPRILVYSNLQLFCKTNADEVQSHGGQLKWRDYGFQTGRRDLSSVERMLRPQHTNATQDIFARPATTDLAIHKSWLQVVAEYSLREISDPHDKLRAISALASRFHDLKGSNDNNTYLAGCWSKTLLVDLSWKLQPHIRPSTRPVEYRAPSWSWASVDGAVSTIESLLEDGSKYIPETERNLKIIDCSTVLNSSDEPFGKVSGGRLVIKGRLKRITTMLKFLSVSQMDLKTKLEGEFAAKLLLNRSSMEAARTIPVATIYLDVDDGFVGRLQQDFNGGGRWCLLLGHLHSGDADSDMAYGLVLAEQSDGFYRRIGSFLGNGDNTRIPDPYTPREFLEYFRACPLDTITII
ncbi:heterokaryon incompatibility protein-domain-containing protein [Cadophora sp. MPI-SDFR-AT-0126]|nr:heterokaryon incompatibility protein-domain-containing protein [Leotiomycetes sp. MPI-SDFR-AT-0126]